MTKFGSHWSERCCSNKYLDSCLNPLYSKPQSHSQMTFPFSSHFLSCPFQAALDCGLDTLLHYISIKHFLIQMHIIFKRFDVHLNKRIDSQKLSQFLSSKSDGGYHRISPLGHKMILHDPSIKCCDIHERCCPFSQFFRKFLARTPLKLHEILIIE